MSETVKLDPSEIKIREDLPRFRTSGAKINNLAESILKHGQIQPVVINRENELIAGGRRLAACIIAGIQVRCEYMDTVDPFVMRELELEENVQREDFTPAEHVLAVDELHNLKQRLHGEVNDVNDDGWSQNDTAELMGVTRTSVNKDLQLAQVIKEHPELKGCKTKSEISKAARAIENLMERSSGLIGVTELDIKDRVKLRQSEALPFMKGFEDESIDLILTDPPYGIDIQDTAIGIGGKTGGELTSSGFKFEDSQIAAVSVLETIATEGFRITKRTGSGYIFIGPEYLHIARTIFERAGWNVHIKPLIWIKHSSGQCNMPERWPSSCYEMLLYIRKDSAKLIRQGQPDWFQCDPITSANKRHPTEKPLALLREFISRSTHPGMSMIDPCCGSGSALVAGLQEGLIVNGCDKLAPAFKVATDYISWVVRHMEADNAAA